MKEGGQTKCTRRWDVVGCGWVVAVGWAVGREGGEGAAAVIVLSVTSLSLAERGPIDVD
jgi:hypothetical protein